MSTSRFTLFRIQAHEPQLKKMFGMDMPRREILQRAICEKPGGAYMKTNWKVGNVADGTARFPNALTFAVGKPRHMITPTLDQDGDFHDVELEHAPYVYAVLDLDLQVLALQDGRSGMPTARTAAKALRTLLQTTQVVRDLGYEIAIDPLMDPREFLETIRQSAALTRLMVTFTLPNIFDPGDFQKKMQGTTEALDGNEGRATFVGKALNKANAEKLIRQGSAIGRSCTAWVKAKIQDRKARKIHMTANPVQVQVDAPAAEIESHREQLTDDVMREISAAYQHIRHEEQ